MLLAEDGIDNQILIRTFLEKAGATVTVVTDGQLAVQAATDALAAGRAYDVVLMDMQMPVLDGYGATSKLRLTGYRGPVVALTAHATEAQGALAVVHEQIADVVAALTEVPALDALLADREVDTAVKVDVVRRVLADAHVLVRNTVALLAEKGRAGEIREVAAEFDALVSAQEHVLSVEVTTAEELSDADFGRILADIERKSGRKVQASRSVEPDLIGGIVLQAGSLRLDASVRGQFDRLRQVLGAGR